MESSKKLVAALLVLGALGVVTWRQRAPVSPTPAVIEHLSPLVFSVPAGRELVYSFRWAGSSTVRWREKATSPEAEAKLPPQLARGNVDTAGQLVVRSYGKQGAVSRFSLRVASLSSVDMKVLEQPMFQSTDDAMSMLNNVDAMFDVDEQGHVAMVHVPIEVPQQGAHLLRRMVRWFEVSLPPGQQGESWTAVETGPSGKARVGYQRTAPTTLERRRGSYESFDFLPPGLQHGPARLVQHGQVLWSDDGWFAIADEESLELPTATGELAASQSTHLAIDRTEVRSFELPKVAAITATSHDSRRLDDMAPRADMRKKTLEARVQGFELTDLRREMLTVTPGSKAVLSLLPKATAWLELHPEDCQKLIADFSSFHGGTQALLFDIFSAIPNPAAQTAMREAISSAKGLDTQVESALLQRFGKIANPSPETMAFLTDRMRNASRPSPQREAVIFALGSATRQAGMSGADVSGAITTLRDALRGDGSVAARVQGLRALGNAGRPELVSDAVAAARDDSPQVRAAAAEALRRVPTEPAQRALWTLSKDTDGDVQSAAFKALTEHPITPAAWQDLGATLKAGEVNPQAGPALVSMLREHLASSELVPTLLMTVANDERFDSSLRGRAYDLVAPAKGHDK